MGEDRAAIIHQAERVIYQSGWRLQEEAALHGLADTRGLRWAPLEPRSDVIQLVTYDGEHLGHIRRDGSPGPGTRWVAVLRLPGPTIGCYGSARDAAGALARACGKEIPRHGPLPEG